MRNEDVPKLLKSEIYLLSKYNVDSGKYESDAGRDACGQLTLRIEAGAVRAVPWLEKRLKWLVV